MFIPIDEAFPAHRKTLRFCGLMQDHNAFAYLIRLWAWAARSAPDGELAGLEAMDIEIAIQYRHTDGRCYAAMVKAGFIDEDEPGLPARIHSWMEHTGGSIQRMEASAKVSRERKQNWRRRRAEDGDGREGNGEGTLMSRGTFTGQDAEERPGNAHRTGQARQGQEDPDLGLSSPSQKISIPDPAGARVAPSVPGRTISGHWLCLLFGQVRSKEVGGLPWQAVRVANGKASEMAEMLSGSEELLADVEPTMALLFHRAKTGKSGKSSEQILRDPSFAFGAWCSSWTSLREELHGVAPEAPPPPPEKRFEPFAVAAERQRKDAALEERVERTIRDLAPKVPVKSPRQEWRERQEKEQQEKGAAGT